MPKLVVVIDDERPIRDLVSTLLTEEGWPVRTYGSAVTALNDITSGTIRPDVILLDMRMPGMDGPRFAEELRQHAPHTPIVVMTAARDARMWAEAIGAAGYIPKPFDIDWVIDTVTGIVGEPEGRNGTSKFSLLPVSALLEQKVRAWAALARPRPSSGGSSSLTGQPGSTAQPGAVPVPVRVRFTAYR